MEKEKHRIRAGGTKLLTARSIQFRVASLLGTQHTKLDLDLD
jgi:hypothetical protein